MSSNRSIKSARITFPTVLTIIRMLLSIVFLIFVTMPYTWARIVALALFIIAAITDKIDGTLARKSQKVTDLGAFLDPLADKMLVDLALLALTYLNVIPLWVFAIIIIRDLAVDGLRMVAAKKGETIAASNFGKAKTATQMTALIIFLLNLIINQEIFTILGFVALYLALVLTIYSGFDYFRKGWKLLIK